MRHFLLLSVLFGCVSAAARADIYEWRDANGNRHFTNSLVNVPAAQQADARVIVTATVDPQAGAVPVSQPAVAPRTEAQVVYDYSQQPDPYTQGLQEGIALARAARAGDDGGGVYINGPLAVANA